MACSTNFEAGDWRCVQCGHEPVQDGGFSLFSPELAKEGAGFDSALFPRLADLEARNFWFRARNRIIVSTLRRLRPACSRYLEIGCGTGFVLSGIAKAFPGARLTASDAFVDGLGFAARRVPRAELLQMDAREIPFAHEFDVIGAYDVVEHIEQDEQVLAQIHNALRPGGLMLLTVPQHAWLWSAQDEMAHHVRRYSSSELLAKVRNVGFEVIHHTSFVTLLLPAMYASRAASRLSVDPRDPMAELHIHPVLNRLFESIMAVEHTMIKAGIRLPVGGSLLIAAQRKGDSH